MRHGRLERDKHRLGVRQLADLARRQCHAFSRSDLRQQGREIFDLVLETGSEAGGLASGADGGVASRKGFLREADERLGADPVFRDPERMAEAEDLVERALAGDTPPAAPIATFLRDAFDVGASNQLAAHAADEVTASPGAKGRL